MLMLIALDLPPTTVRIYVEDSPAVQQLLEQAAELRNQDRPADALDIYHRINTEHPDKLIHTGESVYVDAVFRVRRELLNDEQLLSLYRRIYEPEAKRNLESASREERPIDAVSAVFSRYLLTPTGMEAGLLLASQYMERADFLSAGDVLDQLSNHPDIDQVAGRYDQLQATAGLLSGRHDRYEAYHAKLEEAGRHDALESLAGLAGRLHPPLRLRRLASCGLIDAGPQPVSMTESLWREVLPRATSDLIYRSMLNQNLRARGKYDAAVHLPVLPTISSYLLFVNEGEQLQAMDRRSGRSLWVYDWWESLDYEMKVKLNRASRIVPDKRGVLVMGDHVYAVLGRALESRLRNVDAGDLTMLVSMEKLTGRLNWEIRPSDLDPEFTNAYFLGSPVEGYNRIFILVHRSQATGFQDTFLAALDPVTGRLLWRRHVSSTMSATRHGFELVPRMTACNGRIYVYDNEGALACINARTGSMAWLHVSEEVDDDVFRQRGRVNLVEREPVMPVVVTSGVLLVHPERDVPAMLIDSRTGHKLRDLTGVIWEQARYCQAAGGDALLMGEEIIRVDGEHLDVKWRTPLNEAGGEWAIGRAAVTRQYVVVTTRRDHVVINMADGHVIQRTVHDSEPGNLLAVDDELVVAGATGIRAYMRWEDARDDMIRQIESNPADAGVGLSLAHLAISLGQDQQVLEGFDYALAALEHADAASGVEDVLTNPPASHPPYASRRDEIIDQLLRFVRADSGASNELRQALFDRLARCTSSAEEEVAYHLALGLFMEEQGRWPAAVEHYQAVLLDPTLAKQYYVYEGNRRQAARESRRRLRRIVSEQGKQVYSRYDAMASQRLSELSARRRNDPEALIEIVDQYPLATAAAEALYMAADLYAKAGNHNATVNQLRRAYQYARDPLLLANVIGRLAEHYERNHYPIRAMHWLKRVRREHPRIQPMRGGMPVSIDDWLAELSLLRASDAMLPVYHLPACRPAVLAGRIVPRAVNVIHTDQLRDMVIHHGKTVSLYNGADMQKRWEYNIEKDQIQLLAADDERVLFWSDADAEILAIDGKNGMPIWPAISVDTLLDEAGKLTQPQENRVIEDPAVRQIIQIDPFIEPQVIQRQADQEVNQYLLGVGETVICIMDRFGRTAAMDIHTGEVLWRMMCKVKLTTAAAMSEYLLAIAGVRELSSDELTGNVWVVDQVTGEQVLATIELNDSPQWLGFAGENLLLAAVGNVMTAYKLSDGAVAWQVTIQGRPLDESLKDEDNLLLILDNRGVLNAVDIETGEIVHQANLYALIRDLGSEGVRDIACVDQQCHAISSRDAVTVATDTRLRWRIADGQVENPFQKQFVSQEYLILAGELTPEMLPGIQGDRVGDARSRYYDLLFLDRFSGMLLDRFHVGPFDQPVDFTTAQLVSNHLAFTSGHRTILIPGAIQID